MTPTDPAKRIPKSLGTDTKLFGRFTLTDVAVGLSPGVLVILVTQTVLPPTLTIGGYALETFALPIAGLGIVLGALFVYLTPAYTTSLDWLGTFAHFHRHQKELTHEQAKQYTQLERVYPDDGVIERTDGAYVGLIQVEPPSMALATDAEWRSKAEAFQDFCNTVIEFPIQIYSTTQVFPVDDYLDRYSSRLDDPDVKANPQLAALITNYIEWYERDLDDRQMTIRDHYVVVSVSPGEIQFERDGLLDQLASLPVVGIIVEAWFAPRSEEQHEAMIDTLDDRLQRVRTGLREIEGCTAHRVPVTAATRLVGEYWAGESIDYGDMDRVLRTRPLVGGRR
ncbi:MAG: hypothetical protein ABEI76_05660 [Halobacteriales archaeon]